MHARARLALLALVAGSLAVPPAPAAAADFVTAQRRYSRVDAAFNAHDTALSMQFAARGAAWPPRELYLRVFKREGAVEVWAAPAEGADDPARHVLVETIPVCAASGVLGPKTRSGDRQVPEGFYTIDRFNPRSSYHLSLGVDYPNAVDRARARAASAPPGGDIFIHGDCVTIGCVPLRDGPMERLYVTAVRARAAGQRAIPVHMFPCRPQDAACGALLAGPRAEDPALDALWSALARADAAFTASGRPPRVRVRATGYVVATP